MEEIKKGKARLVYEENGEEKKDEDLIGKIREKVGLFERMKGHKVKEIVIRKSEIEHFAKELRRERDWGDEKLNDFLAEKVTEGIDPERYCDICDTSFNGKRKLKKHRANEHDLEWGE